MAIFTNKYIYKYLVESKKQNSEKGRFENIYGSLFYNIKLDNDKKQFIIKGINFEKFYIRLKELYQYNGIGNLFDKTYSAFDMFLWEKELKNKRDMKIVDLRVHLFFALEIYKIFQDLADRYNLPYYNNVSKGIYNKTWISNFEKRDIKPTNTQNLSNIKYTLKDYQKEFIEKYNILKYKFDLEGYILTFEQGLGKTLTAISLAECLNKKQIIIVCPNSLRDNWAYEIKSYFLKYDNIDIWKSDVYVKGNKNLSISKNPKYIIVNQESIDSIYNIIDYKLDTMIIVDECHNFRNSNSNRVKLLLELKDKCNCKDNLMMSGTPIKSTPDELIPALRMIDPYFTQELAEIYKKAFNQYSSEISRVVKERFSRVIYRKTKSQVLQLPEKYIKNVFLSIKNPEPYYLDYLKKQTIIIFTEEYNKKLDQYSSLKERFEYIVTKYSSANKKITKEYLDYICKSTNPKEVTPELHEHREQMYNNFLENYVYINITDKNIYKELQILQKQYIFMKNSAMGIAIGKIFPTARTNCYIEIFDQNINYILDSIKNNSKKTIIFTQFLKVAKHINVELTKNNIGNVLIIGETKNRLEVINRFKEDDSIDVLIATTQTLSTGVTLTEANQILFFGTPYRDADFQQACDRIHRIGQTLDVYIYIILLKSAKKNITNRLDDIINWSKQSTTDFMDLE